MSSDPVHRVGAKLAAAASVAELHQRHKLGLLALERTPIPLVVTDPRQHDNPIVLANEAFLEMTGYSAEEVVGRNCRFLQGPDTDPAAIAAIREAIAGHREIRIEILNYHRSGRPLWNQVRISPVFDDTDAICFYFASQIDVTAERAAADLRAAEHLLLKEVDHRAKNALALVQAIMRLTKMDDPEAYSRVVQGRVDALARAHSLLAEGRWRGVQVAQLLQGQIAPFGSRRVRVAGPAVLIASAQVQPLVLLVHEMLANAARHGALAREGGQVLLDWSVSDADEVVLKWREVSDVSLCHRPEPALGLSMVTTMIERQLRGRSAFVWQAPGLEAEFVFPMVRSADGLPAGRAAARS